MDRLIVLNIGDYWFPNSRASIEAAASRWGLDLVEITVPILPAMSALSSKFYLSTLGFSRGTRCLFLDCDMVVRDDCPNPIDFVPPTHFGAVPSDQGDMRDADRWHKVWFEGVGKRVGVDLPYHLSDQINGGLLVWTAGVHDTVFKACRMVWGTRYPNGLYEQATLAWALSYTQTPVTYLPPTMNRLRVVWGSPAHMNEYVYHFAAYRGFRTDHKKRFIDRTIWRSKSDEFSGKFNA